MTRCCSLFGQQSDEFKHVNNIIDHVDDGSNFKITRNNEDDLVLVEMTKVGRSDKKSTGHFKCHQQWNIYFIFKVKSIKRIISKFIHLYKKDISSGSILES